jgi:hypothetical protein
MKKGSPRHPEVFHTHAGGIPQGHGTARSLASRAWTTN